MQIWSWNRGKLVLLINSQGHSKGLAATEVSFSQQWAVSFKIRIILRRGEYHNAKSRSNNWARCKAGFTRLCHPGSHGGWGVRRGGAVSGGKVGESAKREGSERCEREIKLRWNKRSLFWIRVSNTLAGAWITQPHRLPKKKGKKKCSAAYRGQKIAVLKILPVL